MDFRLAPEDEAFRQEVHDFIEKECPPSIRGKGVNFFEEVPALMSWRKKIASKGWVAPAWPKEYGGAGMSIMQQFVYSLETATLRAPAPIIIGGLAVAVIGPTIIIYGSEEQKQKHITKILAGEEMWCQGFSEPESGSDLASLKTRAVKDGDEWVINGQKIWTTLAHMSQYMLCLARTDPDAPKHKGISYFIIPMNAPGVTVRPINNMANTHEFNEVFFEDVRIPAKNLVGEENRGWYEATTTLDIERSNIGSAVGQNQAVEDLCKYAREHRDNGAVRLDSDPSLRYELAERAVEAEVSMMLS
jgi:alkylation response protein AidB-like acyl-CoA dehydrogenase